MANRSFIQLSLIYLANIILGMTISVKGATVSEMMFFFKASESYIGSMLMAVTLGGMVASIIGGYLCDYLNAKYILLFGMAISFLSFAFFGQSKNALLGIILMGFMGIGAGFIQVSTSTLVIRLNPQKSVVSLNLCQFFYGIGAVFGPLIASFISYRKMDWKYNYIVVAIMAFCCMLIIIRTRFASMTSSDLNSEKMNFREILSFKNDKTIYLLAVIGMIYMTLELGVSEWSSEYFMRYNNFTASSAQLLLSIFWGGLTLGRLVCTVITKFVKPEILIIILSTGAAPAMVFAYFINSYVVVAVAVFFIGLFFSGIFPTIIFLGGTHYSKHTGTVTGLISSFSGFGASILRKGSTYITQIINLKVSICIMIVLSLLLIIFSGIMNIKAKIILRKANSVTTSVK